MNVRERAILHFKKYKLVYAAAGCVLLGAALAGITAYMMKEIREKTHLNGYTEDLPRQLYDHLSGQRSNATTSVDNLQAAKGEKLRIIGDTACEKLRIIGDTGYINFGQHFGDVVSVLEREGRGHPGYLVTCLENGVTYKSQSSAAEKLGLDATQLSNHLNGRTPHVKGYHFERLNMAA